MNTAEQVVNYSTFNTFSIIQSAIISTRSVKLNGLFVSQTKCVCSPKEPPTPILLLNFSGYAFNTLNHSIT